MSAIARYLLKLLGGAVVGALLGVLVGGVIVGYSWEASALIGGGVEGVFSQPSALCMAVATIIHSEEASRGATHPYKRDD